MRFYLILLGVLFSCVLSAQADSSTLQFYIGLNAHAVLTHPGPVPYAEGHAAIRRDAWELGVSYGRVVRGRFFLENDISNPSGSAWRAKLTYSFLRDESPRSLIWVYGGYEFGYLEQRYTKSHDWIEQTASNDSGRAILRYDEAVIRWQTNEHFGTIGTQIRLWEQLFFDISAGIGVQRIAISHTAVNLRPDNLHWLEGWVLETDRTTGTRYRAWPATRVTIGYCF